MKIFNRQIYASALGAFLGIEQMADEIKKEAQSLFVRADAPKQDWVPEDLRDSTPNFINTSNGYRQSGRILPEDIKQGSMSPAVIVLLNVIISAVYFLSMLSQTIFDKSIGQIMLWGGGSLVAAGIINAAEAAAGVTIGGAVEAGAQSVTVTLYAPAPITVACPVSSGRSTRPRVKNIEPAMACPRYRPKSWNDRASSPPP